MHLFGTITQVVTIALQLALVGIIVRKRAWRGFTWFSVYILYQLFEGTFRSILFACYGNGAIYGYWYWRTEIIDVFLAIGVAGESWLRIFKLFTRIWWFQAAFWGAVAVLLTYWCVAIWGDPTMKRKLALLTIWRADLIGVFIPVAIGSVYFIFLRFFRLGMPRWETGVILGLMATEIFALVPDSTHGLLSSRVTRYTDWAGVIGYIVAELIWIYTFFGPDTGAGVRRLTIEDLEDLQKRLSDWTVVLKGRTRLPK